MTEVVYDIKESELGPDPIVTGCHIHGVGLTARLTAGLAAGLAAGPGSGLAVGLTVGLAIGLAVGLAVRAAVGLAVVLITFLVYHWQVCPTCAMLARNMDKHGNRDL